ncbi:hypothetical protein [Clostridium sp.]|uniref:hypothetical protein n=1 Tax=Clostridium sp. TaxID=1506 RepID=UPI001DD1F110|nr:hypothetical protein [Clostridium sp.]MBS5306498.1 hypothetical protein [Clostridium sp.]
MKKVIRNLVDISFILSLTLLGKFNLQSFNLSKYQIVVTVFCVSGILKFMNSESDMKEQIIDSIKDLVISIAIIPLWYLISNNVENEIFEPGVVVIHFIALIIVLYCAKKSAELSGSISYYTHAIIPVIAIIFIKLGIPDTLSVIIAIIITEPINYFCYKKKRLNNVKER